MVIVPWEAGGQVALPEYNRDDRLKADPAALTLMLPPLRHGKGASPEAGRGDSASLGTCLF